jgi:protein farnesyltransferase/geranylgeranyltransferase type-1 subunit alpha
MTDTAPRSVLDELCSPYLPFDATSPVWSDVTPVAQAESSSPMCPILYNADYSSAMDVYRALVSSNAPAASVPLEGIELSTRALALTAHLIQLNPSHFSVWHYRANILLYARELEQRPGGRASVLRAELGWLDNLAHANMKSYQVWQHRRIVVAALGDPANELQFSAENLARDAKNYHTWAYRQWVLAHFGGLSLPTAVGDAVESPVESPGKAQFPQLWEGELGYVDELLREDVRNNSAWNHRWYVCFARFGISAHASVAKERVEAMRKTIAFEKAYARASILGTPNNASAWTYLRALHNSVPHELRTPMSEALPWVETLVSTPKEAEADATVDIMGRSPVGALEWCLDCITTTTPDAEQRAEHLVKRLITVDSVRKRFWAYRLKSIRRQF